MKFAIGFAVGAFVGRPILNAAGRKIDLLNRVRINIAVIAYEIGDRISGSDEYGPGDIPPRSSRVWRTR
jgi:hypothetical protein